MARGSIEQRSPGTWSIRIELLTDPVTGKRRQKRIPPSGAPSEMLRSGYLKFSTNWTLVSLLTQER
jgi:hypothetical protein